MALFELMQSGNSINLTDLSIDSDSLIWNLGDGTQIIGDGSLDYVYAEPGLYEVCLTVFNQCSSDTTCEVVEVLPTSLLDFESLDALRLFPNPASDEIYLTWKQDSEAEVILTNKLGAKVSRLSNLFLHDSSAKVDLSHLPVGVYTLTLESKGQMIRKKFLVIR